jgi:hypothetical protein
MRARVVAILLAPIAAVLDRSAGSTDQLNSGPVAPNFTPTVGESALGTTSTNGFESFGRARSALTGTLVRTTQSRAVKHSRSCAV